MTASWFTRFGCWPCTGSVAFVLVSIGLDRRFWRLLGVFDSTSVSSSTRMAKVLFNGETTSGEGCRFLFGVLAPNGAWIAPVGSWLAPRWSRMVGLLDWRVVDTARGILEKYLLKFGCREAAGMMSFGLTCCRSLSAAPGCPGAAGGRAQLIQAGRAGGPAAAPAPPAAPLLATATRSFSDIARLVVRSEQQLVVFVIGMYVGYVERSLAYVALGLLDHK